MNTNSKNINYKTLSVNLDEGIKPEEKAQIDHFLKQISNEEFYYSFTNGSITLYLRSLDIQLFKTLLNSYQETIDNKKVISKLYQIFNAINSIKSYGLKGKKRIYIDYNKERKVKNRKLKEVNRNQFFYAKDNNFSANNNPIPNEFINQIICGDSEEVLKNLPDNSIDLIFTSPPYNFGLDYNANDDNDYWEEYFDKLFRIFEQCIRVLKYGGRIAINIQPLFSDYIPSHHIISNFFLSKKLIWKGEILWEKNNYNCKYTAWGSWKSPSNPYLKYTWEFIEIFTKGTLKKEGRKDLIDLTEDEFKKWVIAKWSIAPERKMQEYDHPAMFPEELAARVIKLFSFQNDIVLDPFNGVGTTTYVAKLLNRKYIGIDISEQYCKTAENRLNIRFF